MTVLLGEDREENCGVAGEKARGDGFTKVLEARLGLTWRLTRRVLRRWIAHQDHPPAGHPREPFSRDESRKDNSDEDSVRYEDFSNDGMGSVARSATRTATAKTTTTTTTTATAATTTTTTTTTSTTTTSTDAPPPPPMLTEREQLKIEFYKTYDVMTGVRIAATLGGFFGLMVLLVVYKSRCKSSKQLKDPRLTAAAAAAVAEAEAEERALAAALEAIIRLPPRPGRGPRRSLCIEMNQPMVTPRFASVGGGYDALLAAAPIQDARLAPPSDRRRCSSVTCSSAVSSYLERRNSAMVMPYLPPPSYYPRYTAYDEPWDLYNPIDIQVIHPTPDLSPCGSQIGLHGVVVAATCSRRAPLASMGSVDPPDPDSRSLGSDSVFLDEEDETLGTEDEVSGFSTDSDAPGPSCRGFLRVPPRKKRQLERWNGCAGCVPRRRAGAAAPAAATAAAHSCQLCMTISASVEAPRSPTRSSPTSSSHSSAGSPPPPCSSPIEFGLHRPPAPEPPPTTAPPPRLPTTPPVWSQETLF